jgi:hypothetical protein
MFKKHLNFILIMLSVLLFGGCTPKATASTSSYQYGITVQGAVNRTILQKEFYLEPIGEGREHIYIQEMGPGDDIKVLDIAFPQSTQSGNYQLSSTGPANVGYYEVVGNISRQFHENVQGTLVVNRSDQTVSGSFDFVAQEPLSGESVRIVGEYVYQKQIDTPQQNPTAPSEFNETFFTIVFGVLAVLQFIIQFYVGGTVFKGQNLSVLRSLSGRRTFALGWRDPSLREVMYVWTFVLILMGVVVVYVLSQTR